VKVLLCGEGPHDIGADNCWNGGKREYEDLEGWLHAFVRKSKQQDITFGVRRRNELQITARDARRYRKRPAGHGSKALIAKLVAVAEDYDVLIFMVDADSPEPKTWRHIVDEVEAGFNAVEGSTVCIPCVPMSASESWLMADSGAWLSVAGYNGDGLPAHPEEIWGGRDDPDGDHPHRFFARICGDAGVPDNRETRVDIASATDLASARAACPTSLDPFLADLESVSSD
jgi:hypothetical protein